MAVSTVTLAAISSFLSCLGAIMILLSPILKIHSRIDLMAYRIEQLEREIHDQARH